MSLENNYSVEPLFFKQGDFLEGAPKPRNDAENPVITTFDVCEAVTRMIGPGKIDGAQAPDPSAKNGVWRLYFTSKQARTDMLLRLELRIMDVPVHLYDTNPAATGQSSPDDTREKITVKYLPMSVNNDELTRFLEERDIKLTSEVKYARARDKNGKLTSYKTGDRYCFAVAPIKPLLPRNVKIAGIRCKIFHNGQFLTECKVCGVTGHKAGSSSCEGYNEEKNITAFKGHKHVLSNYFKCKVNAFGKTFPGGIEFAYQWKKASDCGRNELAQHILNASHAGEAKSIAQALPEEMSEAWEMKSEKTMMHLLELKAKQCPEFRQALLQSEKYIAEGTADRRWGTGLTPEQTMSTKPSHWPGKNTMGTLLMDLREKLKTAENGQKENINTSFSATEELWENTPKENDTILDDKEESHDEIVTPSQSDMANVPDTATPRQGRPRKKTTHKTQRAGSLPSRARQAVPKELENFLATFKRSRTPKRKPSGDPIGHQPSPRPKLEGDSSGT